jgi:Protein of unknown function (DUF4232)
MRSSSLAAATAAGVGAAAFAVGVLGAGTASAAGGVVTGVGTPMCVTSQLGVGLGGGDAGAGNVYRYVVFTNHGRTACHLTGFPGVSLLDASGTPIGQPAAREGSTYAPVVLRPGGSASDTLHTVNHQGTCLPTSAQVRVYPPGNRAAAVVPGRITVCYGTFGVTPLTAGTAGNPAAVTASTHDATPTPTATPAPTRSATAAPAPTRSPTATPAPTRSAGPVPEPARSAAPAPTRQVPVVPSGAPDTGVVASGSASSGHGNGTTTVAAGAAGGALAVGGLGLALRRRRAGTAGTRG